MAHVAQNYTIGKIPKRPHSPIKPEYKAMLDKYGEAITRQAAEQIRNRIYNSNTGTNKSRVSNTGSGIAPVPTLPTRPAPVPAPPIQIKQGPALPTLGEPVNFYDDINLKDKPDYFAYLKNLTRPDFYSDINIGERPDYYSNIDMKRPDGYESKYLPYIESLFKDMGNRKFNYDLNADTLYHQMKDRYIQQGQQAMMDAQGQAASLTGGYGNSYAQQAGQQAYNQHLTALNDQIPALRNLAFNEWLAEGDQLQRQFENVNNMERMDYGKYRDTINDWQNDRDTQIALANAKTNDYYNYLNAQMNLAGAKENAYQDDFNNQMNIANAQNTDYYNYLNQQMKLAGAKEDSHYNRLGAEMDMYKLENDKFQQERKRDYDLAMNLLQMGQMPNDSMLASAGIDRATAQQLSNSFKSMSVPVSSGGSSGRRSGGGGGGKKTNFKTTLYDSDINRLYEFIDEYGYKEGVQRWGDMAQAKGIDPELIANTVYDIGRYYKNDKNTQSQPAPTQKSNSIWDNVGQGLVNAAVGVGNIVKSGLGPVLNPLNWLTFVGGKTSNTKKKNTKK